MAKQLSLVDNGGKTQMTYFLKNNEKDSTALRY